MSRQVEEMQPLVPPRYANVASSSLYDPDLPNSLKVVLGQIEGLAWQNKSRETPPLTVYELACICNLGVRQMWRNLGELETRGWVTVKRQRQWQMVLQTRLPPEPGSDTASEHPVFEANLAALAEFGVKASESLARQVAALPHVTPALIRTWGRTMQTRRGVRNLPGLLLHMLQVTDGPPRPGKDLRPASGIDGDAPAAAWQAPAKALTTYLPEPPPAPAPAEDSVGPSAASLPDGALPAALRRALRDLGWEDDLSEVVGIVARDGDEGERVWAWIRHVEQNRGRYTNPAGFLRTVLRGDNWPKKEGPVLSQSKEEPDESERGQPPWGENIGDRLEVV